MKDLVIKNIRVNVYTKLECVALIPDADLNKYFVAAANKEGWDRSILYRLAMTSTRAPYHQPIEGEIVKPNAQVFALGVVGTGAPQLGIHSGTTVIVTQDEMFKRLTWNDLGIYRESGFSEQKSKILQWYLRKLIIDADTKEKVTKLFAKGI